MSKTLTFNQKTKSKKQPPRATKRSHGKLSTLDIANSTLYGDAPAPYGRLHSLTVKGL